MPGTRIVSRGRVARRSGPRRSVPIVAFLFILSGSAVSFARAGAIHQAIADGDRAQVAGLLRQDPSLANAAAENLTRDLPLHTAATAGQVELARLLLDAGANIDGLDSDESTPLDCAALSRRPEMVRFLLERGADVNRRDRNGSYSLSFAASAGDSACIRLLLDAGADLNFVPPRGPSLLHFACTRGTWWLADRLLAAGADINRGDFEGTTPLHMVCQVGNLPRVEQTLARGASVEVADSSGMTALHMAAMSGRTEVVRLLLERGADPNAVDDAGSTPLIWSAGGEAAIVRLLLERGAKANIRNNWGGSPLSIAVDEGKAEIVDLLLAAGTDPREAGLEAGRTPLHVASLLGYRDCAERLRAAGADPLARDAAGRTPVELARQYGQWDVARCLESRGRSEGAAEADPGPLVIPRVGAKEAYVWSLGHSAWAVKTKKHFLVFDNGTLGRTSDDPSLRNGTINPAEIAGENVAVFVSHEHGDHYSPSIFGWKSAVPRARYFLGFRPRPTQAPGAVEVTPADYEFTPPGTVRTVDGMKITTIESNDSGVGFLVEVDGLTIFHAGDHANRYRDLSGPFKAQIDGLVAKGVRPDLAFLPVSGCSFGDQVAVKIGVEYELAQLNPKVFLPMHGGRHGTTLADFVASLGDSYPGTRKVAVGAMGDWFHYRDGLIL